MIHTLIGRLTGWEKKYREALAQRDENAALATGYALQADEAGQRIQELTAKLSHLRLDLQAAHRGIRRLNQRNTDQQEAVDLITRAQQQMGLNDSGIPTARKYLADAKSLLGGEANGAQ